MLRVSPRPTSRSRTSLLLPSALAALVLATLAGCTGAGGGPDAGADAGPVGCTSHEQCGSGAVCAGGRCVIGECVDTQNALCRQEGGPPEEIAGSCCKPWEVCNFDYQCIADPDSIFPGECFENEDCPNPGQFCSGSRCYDSAGRTPCTATFQCPSDERCDPTVFLCVPDLGGCTFCSDFPELCCVEEGELCDVETGFCLDTGEIECETAEDCRPGQQCDELSRCVQCVTDDDCGPGTACNQGTGDCYSTALSCSSDEDCDPPRLCAPATDECVNPQCLGDAQCFDEDSRMRCDLSTYQCYLPPAACDEDDEPNNSLDEATPIQGGAAAGTLCRGDSDYLRFPVTGDKRYRVTVSLPDFNGGGLVASVIRPAGTQADSDTFATFDDEVTVSMITEPGEEGTGYLKLVGDGDEADLWAYSVTVVETEAPDIITCEEEEENGVEPNDSFASAYELEPGAASFARCDDEDVDYYRITVPPQHGLDVTVEFDNDDGDMAIELYDAPDADAEIDSSDGASADVEHVEAPEGSGGTYYLRVALWSSFASGVDGQAYTITATPVARPPICDEDPGEPENDTFATAPVLPVNMTVEQRHCVPVDVDVHRIDLEPNYGGSLALSFDHTEGDLRVDLYDSQEELLSSSNSSMAGDGQERIELPFSGQAETYYARVRLHAGSSDVGQLYTLTASTYDATTCVASEPVPNGDLSSGQCVGGFATDFPCVGPEHALPFAGPGPQACEAAPETAGCGTLCGATDEDWFRVGTLNHGQRLRARLDYDPGVVDGGPSLGRVGLALGRANSDLTQTTFLELDPDSDHDGVVEAELFAPTVAEPYAREYVVVVRPEGTEGFAALPYSIRIEVGPPCFADDNEPNPDPSQATFLRESGAPGMPFSEVQDATLCGFDTDVYELFAFAGETVRATLLGPPGVTVDLGSRPDPITDPAVLLPGGEGAPLDGPCPLSAGEADGGAADPVDGGLDGGSPDGGGEGCVQAEVANDQVRQVYATVRRTADTPESVGPYQLLIEVE